MHVGILQVKLAIRDAHSLKDKRQVIKSLKDRIRNQFNVSVAEVDAQDAHQSAVLGMAMAGSDRRYMDGALNQVVNFVRSCPLVELVDFSVEVL
ncbi:MAG: DUF503 domain-containing protein [Planctomycetes bacterium]|nr:DUF503 domain-containing protein [Planctomycetota bacterium]